MAEQTSEEKTIFIKRRNLYSLKVSSFYDLFHLRVDPSEVYLVVTHQPRGASRLTVLKRTPLARAPQEIRKKKFDESLIFIQDI